MIANYSKNLFLCLISLFSIGYYHGQISSIELISDTSYSINDPFSTYFIDEIGNTYIVNKDQIKKLNFQGKNIQQSAKKWQQVSAIKPVNALKIALFSESQQSLCFLDNTLTEYGQCLVLNELGYYNITAVETSKRPDLIWLYDEINSSLILFNYFRQIEVQRVDNLSGINSLVAPLSIHETNYGLWIFSGHDRVFLMDDYLNLLQTLYCPFENALPYEKGFFYVHKEVLSYYDVLTGSSTAINISTEGAVDEMYISGNQLFIRRGSKIKVFIIKHT
jgi:hypothetical protein